MGKGKTLILGIETSCDETAAAIVENGEDVLASLLYSQEKIHGRFGGVVPELACRQHVSVISEVVSDVLTRAKVNLQDLSAVAVTQGPGLMGALLVGVSYAKALAFRNHLPLIGVNHLEGHIAAVHLEKVEVVLPAVALVVSGGHTNLYYVPARGPLKLLGRTIDDAAGEAFDKGAKMLGLPFPGGPAIDRASGMGDPRAVDFPRPYLKQANLDMSFSGLKTALRYYLERTGVPKDNGVGVSDVAASYQQAIIDVLIGKTISGANRCGARSVFVTGGVAANSALRRQLAEHCAKHDLRLIIPEPAHCTDNGAMIASAGFFRMKHRPESRLTLSPDASLPMGDHGFTGNGSLREGKK
jgi:tRNA N6-adenosine threonylcarbamoyltransferase